MEVSNLNQEISKIEARIFIKNSSFCSFAGRKMRNHVAILTLHSCSWRDHLLGWVQLNTNDLPEHRCFNHFPQTLFSWSIVVDEQQAKQRAIFKNPFNLFLFVSIHFKNSALSYKHQCTVIQWMYTLMYELSWTDVFLCGKNLQNLLIKAFFHHRHCHQWPVV